MSSDKTRKELLGDAIEMGNFDFNMGTLEASEILNQYPEGLIELFKGYLSYCKEVITNRAIPGIDGLKPVQRRILYTMFVNRINSLTKSHKVNGQVMAYHPHSDTPIYGAMANMTSNKGVFNVPVIEGKGAFGWAYSNTAPSASRYTEVKLNDNAQDYFRDMDGVNYIPNYDDTEKEPVLLPVRYPSLLVNPTQGIAVGIASNIPSFNIKDVIDLAIEYLDTGSIKTVIAPDHRYTGALYIQNNKELYKVMTEGSGKLKFRGRVEINGKDILIVEIPYGVTAETLKKQIEELDIQGVSEVKNLLGREGLELKVCCTAATRVNGILMALYKYTDLQYTMTANMRVIVDDQPLLLGVWGVIEKWCKFRKEVMTKQMEHDISIIERKLSIAKARVKFLSNTEVCDRYIETLRTESKKAGRAYLKSVYKDFSDDEIGGIINISLSQLGDLEEFKGIQEELQSEIDSISYKIMHITETVIKDLKDVKRNYNHLNRKTEVTDIDYIFTDSETEEVVDESPCTILYKDGFIKKVTVNTHYTEQKYDLVLKAKANDTLIGVDSCGRVLRVYLSNIEYCAESSIGTYLPTYWELDSDDLVWLEVLKGQEKMLIYGDGKIGFLDTSEWSENTRQVRVIERGISEHADKLIEVIDIPIALGVITQEGLVGVSMVEDIDKKSRTARTSVFRLDKEDFIKWLAPLTALELLETFNNTERYLAPKVRRLEEASDLKSYEYFFQP